MKKILIILATLLTACGFEEYDVEYGVTSVYFYNQQYNRNIVVGEGLKMRVGSMLTGLLKNDKDRVVRFAINESMVTDPTKSVMPRNYYTLDDNESFVIPKGDFYGYLGVTFDSALLVSDPKSLTGEYILPIEIIGCDDVDSVNAEKDSILISVSYWAKQHGNYYYSGRTIIRNADVNIDTIDYRYNPTVSESIRKLITVNANTLEVQPDVTGNSADPGKGYFSYNVTVPTFGGGSVTITPSANSIVSVSANGASSYDETTKTFYLNYSWNNGINDFFATDTLVFRNRVRDVQADGEGVNEWRGF